MLSIVVRCTERTGANFVFHNPEHKHAHARDCCRALPLALPGSVYIGLEAEQVLEGTMSSKGKKRRARYFFREEPL